ncbi:MAG: hypothetical protein ACE5GJ_00705 [Gemmatimonadota bacterium]
MPLVPFESLPGSGRAWVFPAGRPLEEDERVGLLETVDAFLEGWAAHGAPLRAGRVFLHDRFLVVGVDEDAEAPSGCSIDALVNALKRLGEELGTTFVDRSPVWYRAAEGKGGGHIEAVSRARFRELARRGEVDTDTPVFDPAVARVSQVREGGLERRAGDSWHGRAFFAAAS